MKLTLGESLKKLNLFACIKTIKIFTTLYGFEFSIKVSHAVGGIREATRTNKGEFFILKYMNSQGLETMD